LNTPSLKTVEKEKSEAGEIEPKEASRQEAEYCPT
jgi:hypothetical protein